MRLVRLIRSVPLVMLLLLSTKVHANPLSVESITLAKCEGVYVYLAHLAMMSNNEGLAKNVLFRASLVVTANLFLNEKGGRVSKEVMDKIKTVRRNDKKNLDANPSATVVRAGECDKATPSSIAKARGMGKIWDSRNFDQWQSLIFQQYLDALKIR
jgi:hypothetical protein